MKLYIWYYIHNYIMSQKGKFHSEHSTLPPAISRLSNDGIFNLNDPRAEMPGAPRDVGILQAFQALFEGHS